MELDIGSVFSFAFWLLVAGAVVTGIWAWRDPGKGLSVRDARSGLRYLISRAPGLALTTAWVVLLAPRIRVTRWVLSLALAGSFLWELWRRRKCGEATFLSRGALWSAGTALHRRTGRRADLHIHVVPEGGAPSIEAEDGTRPIDSVFIPRRLLDWMSQAEIEALLAYQIAQIQTRSLVQIAVWMGALCGLVAQGILRALKVGSAGQWVTFLILLSADVVVLVWMLQQWRIRTDLRAIEIGADPEAYFSAMVELSRSGTDVLAARIGITAERALALQHLARPAADRFPTSGTYSEVGF